LTVQFIMSAGDQHVGGITCLLCNATISVRLGNFEKLNAHLEVNHDVFFHHDLLMALNFLEDHERDVIIEKVIPRMTLTLNNAKNLDKRDVLKNKLVIEERLFGNIGSENVKTNESDREDENNTSKISLHERIDYGDIIEDNSINDGDDEGSSKKKLKLDEHTNTKVFDEDALEISLDVSDEVLMGENENQANEESNITTRITPSKSSNVLGIGKDEVICKICQNKFKKKSMYNHSKRCELREKVRLMGEEKKKNERIKAELNEQDTISKDEDEDNDNDDDGDDDKLVINEETELNDPSKLLINMTTCKACDKTFSSRGNLKRHQRQNPSHVSNEN